MESPESGNGAGNCSVGSIVWVRRRNGSWWPGKILGPDELSASHVISPRSGTPVKLLGREDASVDWYNLEKSKRVKAFRCGDFDDCIERAEASQSMPPKKREKYARREDAIVHALELERQMLENKCEEVDCSSDLKSGNLQLVVAVKEPTFPSEYLDSRNEGQLSPITEGGKVLSLLSSEHVSKDKDLYLQQVKAENRHHVTDDDNSKAIPKMGGSMGGYGLRSGHSSLKNNPLAIPPSGSGKSLPDNGSSFNDGFNTNGAVNDHCENSSDKRKRSPEGQIEEPLAKRHDNRHQPTGHVRTNNAKGPISVLQHDNSVNSTFKSEEEHTGGIAHPAKGIRHNNSLTPEGKAGSSNTKALLTPIEAAPLNCIQASNAYEGNNTIESTEDTETDSSETDSLDSDSDDLASLSEGAASIELQPKYPGRSKPQQEYGSLSSDDLEDTSLPDEPPCHPLLGNNDPASSTGVGVGVSRWQLKGKRNNRSLLKRPTSGTKFRSLLAGYEPRSPDGIATPRKPWGSDDYQPVSRGYWDDSVEYFDPLVVCRQQHNENRILLIEVDLKVQSSYQRGHVPLISLMSKIDGRAMVGHPIQVEPLEDGSTDSLLLGTTTTDDWRPETLGQPDTTPLPPTWRTARRTAKFRVPRPDLSSTYDERTKNPRHTDGKKSSQKQKKPSKKTNPSSNQKTRTLSSIASQHKRIGDPKNSINNNNYQVEGVVIKPESLTTGVACIPVKLVFSRLHEELIGRHP